MPRRLPKLSLIGAGSVGATLTLALHEHGYPVSSVISRSGKGAIALARKVGCKRASTEIVDLDPSTEILLIAVSDDSLAQVAALASKHLAGKKLLVLHTSGVHSSALLAPFRRKGAAVASLHPVQTFPRTLRPEKLRSRLKGIFYGVEGSPAGVDRASSIAEELGGRAIVIQEELKPLYHVACVFASNALAALLGAVGELSTTLELKASWMEVFGPLMTATIENVVRDPSGKSLTGPIVRGDLATVDRHLEALERHAPHLLPLYTVAGIEIARAARRAGIADQEGYERLVARFKAFVKTMPRTR
jgi:predicted short-subunit dehydrogenase-like oxidoreductase (DUF2520 family)